VVATWASGGNLPPLLALAALLREAGHPVHVLASNATRHPEVQNGFEPHPYPTAPQPDTSVPFEAQAATVLRTLAGLDIARDVRDLIEETKPRLLVADCMLPAAIVAAQAASFRSSRWCTSCTGPHAYRCPGRAGPGRAICGN
jgi:hypothetical protein